MVDNNGIIHQGSCGIDNALSDLDFTGISMLNGGASTPSLVDNAFGYGTLYLYPIKNRPQALQAIFYSVNSIIWLSKQCSFVNWKCSAIFAANHCF